MEEERVSRRRSKKTKEKESEIIEPKPVEIDFGMQKERVQYVTDKLDDILDTIGGSYGKRLADELMKRLEATIQKFNDDVSGILTKLEEINIEREKEKKIVESQDNDVPEELKELSEIERRLEMKSMENKEADQKESKKKKKK